MQSAEHVYMSQLKAWPYAVLHMIRITIPGCVVLLDLAHVLTEYFLERKKKVQLMKSIEAPCDREEGWDGFSHRLMKLWIQEQLEIAQGV